jgi:hypothetical protein
LSHINYRLYAWVKIIVLLIKGNISNCVYTA